MQPLQNLQCRSQARINAEGIWSRPARDGSPLPTTGGRERLI
jgi:hypothetical protein